MRAMRTHCPNLNESKKSDNDNEPWDEHPTVHIVDPDATDDESGNGNDKKTQQVSDSKMTMQGFASRAVITGLSLTRCDWFNIWIWRFHFPSCYHLLRGEFLSIFSVFCQGKLGEDIGKNMHCQTV
jgi:hypothetical protein